MFKSINPAGAVSKEPPGLDSRSSDPGSNHRQHLDTLVTIGRTPWTVINLYKLGPTDMSGPWRETKSLSLSLPGMYFLILA
jgi:hypothetical protein